MADLIKNYILKRRNNKEIKRLKGKPDKKGNGGINYKLFETVKNGLSEKEVEGLEQEIKDEMTVPSEYKKYEMLVSKAEKHDLDIKNIINGYQKQLQALDRGQQKKNITKLLKGKPNKNGVGGINYKLLKKLKNGLSEKAFDDLGQKIKDQTALLSEQKKYEMLVSKAEKHDLNVKNIIDEYQKLLKKIEDEHDYNAWLSWAAEKADGVSLATHVIKLTHSGISRASCFYDKGTVQKKSYLTTAHIQKPVIDGTGNAALSPIADLLRLKNRNGTLAEQILADDDSGLAPFAKNREQLGDWISGVKKALDNPQKSSHYLAKQVYFPVADNGYHLLSIVPSSSLCHELFERFQDYWSERQEEARDCKKNKKYSSDLCVRYPNKAALKVTASNPQNVSILNGKRKGQWLLLSCQAPVWKSTTKPPVNKRSLFQGEIHYWSLESSKKLQRLLLTVKNKKLSASNPKIHARLSALVEDIIDLVFDYAASIQNLENQAGWSRNAKKLKRSHQFWLDPFRDGDEFQQLRKSVDWQADICRDFSLWLNKRLEHKRLTFGQTHEAFWQKIFKPRLREFNAVMEVKR